MTIMRIFVFCSTFFLFSIALQAQFSQKKLAFYGINDGISEMKTADFNGDGGFDMLIGDHKYLSLMFKLSGQDRYEVPIPLGLGYHLKFEVADLDNDGDTDIVAADAEGHLVKWINPGNGNFGEPQFIDADMTGISEIALADFNEDGFVDITISASDGASGNRGAFVYFNQQNGAFTEKTTLTLPFIGNHFYESICTADVDGDGLVDVITTRSFPFSKIVWFKNLNGQSFDSERAIANAYSYNLLADDMDGDGDPDIVYNTVSQVNMIINNGDGTFQPLPTLYQGSVLYDVKIVDVDLDGDNDIFAARSATSNPRLLKMLNNGDGTFVNSFVNTGDQELAKLHIGEINGDSLPDVMAVTFYDQLILYYINGGFGSFYPYKTAGHVHDPDEIITGDIDADGDEDIILGSIGGSYTSAYLNDGSGNYSMKDKIHDNATTSQAVLYDFNGDGYLDLLKSQDPFLDPMHTMPRLYFNDGTGNFDQFLQMGGFSGFGNYAIPYDMNVDGLMDIVYCRWYENKDIYWVRNNGDSQFSSGGSFFNNGDLTPRFIAFEDMDLDGDDDYVIVYGSGTSTSNMFVYWFQNQGNDIYAQHLIHSGASTGRLRDIELFDINNDGYMDIWTSGIGNSIAFLQNHGQGVFTVHTVDFGLPDAPHNIMPGDFDFDGDLDIAATSEFEHYFVWLENTDGVGGNFVIHVLDSMATGADETAFSDLDGDGKKDLIVITRDEVAYYTNEHPAPPALFLFMPTTSCLDNGTPANPEDDLVAISFIVKEGALSELGDSAVVQIAGISDTIAFGQLFTGGLPLQLLGADSISVIVAALSADSVFINTNLPNPGYCSFATPEITVSVVSANCHDNNTPATSDDDFLTVALLVQQMYLSDSFQVSSPGLVLASITGSYDSLLIFNLPLGSASMGNITLRINDMGNPGYFVETIINNPGPCNTVGAAQILQEKVSFKVFPNPFNQSLTAQADPPGGVYVFELFDLLGRQVFEQSFGSRQLEILLGNTSSSGIYFYTITESETGRVVKKDKLISN